METTASPATLGHASTGRVERLLRATAIALVLFTAMSVVVLTVSTRFSARDDVQWIGTVGSLAIQVLVVASAAFAARRARPSTLRRPWLSFFPASLLVLSAVTLRVPPVWSWLDQRILLPVFLADALQALSYPLYLLGLLYYPATRQQRTARWKRTLDVLAAILAGIIMVGQVLVAEASVQPSSLILWLFALASIIPMVEILSVLIRVRTDETWLPAAALAMAFASSSLSSLTHANLAHLADYSITWELPWLLAQWYFVRAALATVFGTRKTGISRTRNHVDQAIRTLGGLALIALDISVILIMMQQYMSPSIGPARMWFLAGFSASMMLLILRHRLNHRLVQLLLDSVQTARDALEVRVQARTRQLALRVAQVERLSAEALRRAVGMAAVQQATRESLRPVPIQVRMHAIAKALLTALDCDGSWLGLLVPATGRLEHVASIGSVLGGMQGDSETPMPLDPESHSLLMVVVATGEPLVVEDPSNAPIISAATREWAQKHDVSSIACVPIVLDATPTGAIAVSRSRPHPRFDQVDVDLLATFAELTAVAAAETRRYEEIRHRADQQTTLLRTAETVTSSLDLEEVLDTVAREAARLLQADSAAIYHYDRATEELELHARYPSVSTPDKPHERRRIPLAQSDRAAEVVHAKLALLIADTKKDPRGPILLGDVGATSSLLLPLLVQGEVQGLLVLNRFHRDNPFSQQHLSLGVTLTQYGNIAMLNARLYEELCARMEDLKESRDDNMRSQRMQGLRQMVAGAAHELNNPLAVVRGYAELLAGQDVPQQTKDDALRILHAVERCQFVVKNLLTFGGRLPTERGPTNVNEALERSLALSDADLSTANITVRRQLDEDLPPVLGDESLLQQVFFNIITNAWQAMTETYTGGTITVQSSQEASGDTRLVRIVIHNDGPEIPADVLENIFDPFFTTRRPGGGSGLGLSVCLGIVQEHGGHIWAQSPALLPHPKAAGTGKGASFIIELPAMELEEIMTPAEDAPAAES